MITYRIWTTILVSMIMAACSGGGGGGGGSPPVIPPPADTTPPDTSISAAPGNPSNNTDPSFSFASTEGSSTFECALDGGAFASCSSPQSYAGLAEGNHSFDVRATDAAGNTDATPASRDWTIDTTPPDTSITANPPALTNSNSGTFEFTSTESPATFQCSVDGAAFADCTSPNIVTGLADGNHSFSVQATDAAGNTDPVPATYNWLIDTTPPETTITSAPNNPTNSTDAILEFVSSEAGSSFQCSLDGGTFSACISPQNYTALAEGVHSFSVQATDAAGNTDPTPAIYGWEIDITPPDTTIDSGPDDPTNSTSATFAFSSTEAFSSFQCSIDGGAFAACASPANYAALTEGNRMFNVRATDLAGNTDASPAAYFWEIDTTPPDTIVSSGPSSPTNSTDADFVFVATELGSTFQCSIDAGAFVDCTSPQNYSGLSEGDHTFQVMATDPANNTDATPATYDWTVDLTPPVITVPFGITVVAANANGAPASDPAIVIFLAGASASDAVDGDVTAGITHDAPGVFPIGITTVTFSVTDAAGNSANNSSTVEVIPADMEEPDTTSIVINNNAVYAVSVEELTARLIAMDNVGVTDYLVTEHNANDPMNVVPPYVDPLPSDGRWVAVAETDILDITIQFPLAQNYTLGDIVELCAWFMDAQQNISTRVCDSIVYGNDWESGIGNWSVDNGVWQTGTPTAGPSACYGGTECAGTVLNGTYPPSTVSRLISASTVLPSVAGSDEVHLRFQQWFNYGSGDAGQVQVSVWDPNTLTWGAWISEGSAVSGVSGGWSLKDVDLTAYAGERVRIGFLHSANGAGALSDFGWYIDDIGISVF